MAPVISKRVGLMRYGVMLFSLAYLCLSIATAIYILMLQRSFTVTTIAIYCYIQVCANWRALFVNSSKDYGVLVEEGLEQDPQNFCPECNIFKNKKSHHCPLCEYCILRHDHHCFFLGTCIGLNNQRYFVILCLYTGVGSLYLSLQIFLTSDWVFQSLVQLFGAIHAVRLRFFPSQNNNSGQRIHGDCVQPVSNYWHVLHLHVWSSSSSPVPKRHVA
uniref:Palmitoyltransferase n=1 Tax=Daphnia galeata TaxID=27404 RepID=A0A8J2RZ22_9CRUS|nr:unnamed protein product [Daphnia galeata]